MEFNKLKIENVIYLIRSHKIMLDEDLAKLYGIETKALKRAVKRNLDRFPNDFMFVLSREEYLDLRYQIGTLSKSGRVASKYPPMAFTELGIAMLSTVLRSPQAIQVNIAIMRTFVKMRRILASNEEIAKGLRELEKKTGQLFHVVFDKIEELEKKTPALPTKRKKIGL
ncbi:MAG: ORF6N domain-containing protein [Halobacteriovoraceae bacterium]|nr:ORF6N domain-containing protein [Halobacteriovoraceae bacterium]MCB9094111.1 ORF6N domain-containing protein [Halobacteriovoraceae bacterium]